MIITIANEKGGVGKSTIAWNLAIALSKLFPNKLEIIDLDHGKTFKFGVSARIRQKKDGITNLKVHEEITNIDTLSRWYHNVYDETNKKIVLIDTGGYDSDINVIAIGIANIVIVPTNNHLREINNLKNYFQIIDKIGEKIKRKIKLSIVYNKIHPSTSIESLRKQFDEVIESYAKDKNIEIDFFQTFIKLLKDFDESYWDGLSVCEIDCNTKAKTDFEQFIFEIVSKINQIK